MKKIIIASHHNLANGLKSTIEYIAPDTVKIIDINAYLDNTLLITQIEEALENFEKDEQILVFTDLLGGSVNQEFAKKISEYNIELISGVNLPIILTLILNPNEVLSGDAIREGIEESKEQIVYVNDSLLVQELDNEDE